MPSGDFEIFLKLDGIEGESADKQHAGFLYEVTLDYGRIEWEYQPVGPDGKPRGAVKGGWDLRRNAKI